MKLKAVILALAVMVGLFSQSALAMRPLLRWESKLNRILCDGGDEQAKRDRSQIELNLQNMAAAKSLQLPETLNEVRLKLRLLPHPDTLSGATPDRGQSYLMDANEDRPSDDVIPTWAIQNLTAGQRAIYDAWAAQQ